MGGLDPAKVFLLLVIALIVIGPERLPGAARQLGGAWRELNRLRQKFDEEVRALVPDLDLPNIPTSPTKAVTGYLSRLVSGTGTSAATSAVGDAAAETVDTFDGSYRPRGGVGRERGGRGRGLRASSRCSGTKRASDRPAGPRLCRPGRRWAPSRRTPAVPTPCSCFDEPSMN